jgi:iron complex transport system ATP-binding protein
VRTLSGGERQRVAIAALLAQDARLLLLDEPANALDLAHQVSVMHLLASLCHERGKTIVMVVHDLNLAYGVASHALLMNGDGRWLAGTAEETMRADALSDVLGHPVEVLSHGARKIFIPAEKTA